jgi:hypothetical protein
MDRFGEVGRGTFISGDARRGVAAPSEPRGIRIDLEFNYPMLPDQTALIAKSLDGVEKPAALDAALRQATSQEHPAFDWPPRQGAIVLREKIARIAARLANVPRRLIGIEAGMATHHVARELMGSAMT